MTDNPRDLDLEHFLQWQRTRNEILRALAGDKQAIAQNHQKEKPISFSEDFPLSQNPNKADQWKE